MPANTHRIEVKNNHSVASRNAEHDRLVGWRGYKPSTASFVEKCQPRFVKSKDGRRFGRNKSKERVCVYLIRFVSITNPTYSFLKIGITNEKDRFDADSHRYSENVLKRFFCTGRNQALKIEQRLHKRYSEWCHKPKVPLLSGGNSECFLDLDSIVDDVNYVFDELNKLV